MNHPLTFNRFVWTDANGDVYWAELFSRREYPLHVGWPVLVYRNGQILCELEIPAEPDAQPPTLRDVAESLAHHFCSLAIRMAEAG